MEQGLKMAEKLPQETQLQAQTTKEGAKAHVTGIG